eukprot:1898679-Rhodomonas_salina.5
MTQLGPAFRRCMPRVATTPSGISQLSALFGGKEGKYLDVVRGDFEREVDEDVHEELADARLRHGVAQVSDNGHVRWLVHVDNCRGTYSDQTPSWRLCKWVRA